MIKRDMTKHMGNTELKNELTADLIERLIFRVREEMKSDMLKVNCSGQPRIVEITE